MDSTKTLCEYSEALSPCCSQWTNTLIASQYLKPFEIMKKYDPEKNDKKVLDWGCGDGHFSYFLCQQGYSVEGFSFFDLELEPVLQKQFKERFLFTKASAEDPVRVPYASSTFDTICSVGVLEHVRETGGNERASLQEMHRILKPGGLLFVFHFPNRYSWIEQFNRLGNRFKPNRKYTHPFLYHLKEIQQLAKDSHFELVEQGLYNLLPRNMFRKLAPRLANHPCVFYTYLGVEKILSSVFRRFSQNYYVVLRKATDCK